MLADSDATSEAAAQHSLLRHQERLVSASVEDGPRVVAHAAVDGNVGADVGKRLDRPDPVTRQAQPSPTIERPGSAVTKTSSSSHVRPAAQACRARSLRPLRDRNRCPLVVEVGDAKTSADAQFAKLVRLSKGRPALQRSLVRSASSAKDLAADMRVQADEIDALGNVSISSIACCAAPDAIENPNFESSWARHDEFVRVGNRRPASPARRPPLRCRPLRGRAARRSDRAARSRRRSRR